MSSLKKTDQNKLEKLLRMGTGYVSNFSDRTFGEFFLEEMEVNIHDVRYTSNGTSKANKLREFWRLEPDGIVAKCISALIHREEENLPYLMERNPDDAKIVNIWLAPSKDVAMKFASGKVDLIGLKKHASHFDANYLAQQIRRIESSIDEDPSLAIGTAKELIETCCKTILDERGKTVSGTPDIPFLTKETLKELKLVPEGVAESARGSDVIKRLLQNLGTIGNGLAELRGLYGTGHGKHAKASGLTTRHARLAVGAAVTLVTFLFDTHREMPKDK